MHRVFGGAQAASKEAPFLELFEAHKRQAKGLLATVQKRQSELTAFIPLLSVLSGDLDYISTLRTSRWEELFLLYLTCVVGVTEDYRQAVDLVTGSFPGFQRADQLALDLIKTQEVHGCVQTLSADYPLYFVAHLVELFVNAYLLTNEPLEVFDGLSYSETYYSLYVHSLIHDTQVDFRVPCDYVISAIGTLPGAELLIETCMTSRLDFQEVALMIDFCLNQRELGLEDCLENVLKFAIRKRLHHGSALEVVPWLVHTQSKALREEANQAIVRYIRSVGVEQAYAEVRNLPERLVKDSFPLTFLCDYVHFLQLLAGGQVPPAAQLLIEFLIHRTAPKEFWPRIFLDAVPIFESANGQFTYHHFIALLDAFDDVTNPSLAKSSELGPEQVMSISRLLCQSALRTE